MQKVLKVNFTAGDFICSLEMKSCSSSTVVVVAGLYHVLYIDESLNRAGEGCWAGQALARHLLTPVNHGSLWPTHVLAQSSTLHDYISHLV